MLDVANGEIVYARYFKYPYILTFPWKSHLGYTKHVVFLGMIVCSTL